MPIFGKQGERVIRTQWKSVQDLAEELYAIFQQDLPITASSVTIQQPQGATTPPLQINTPSGGDGPIIDISHGDQNFTFNPGDFNDNGQFNGGSGGTGGTIDFGDIVWPGQDPGNKDAATPDPSNPPIALYGVVKSQVSDNVYEVEVWAKSPALYPSIGIINVRAPALDTSDILPAGYVVSVTAFPGEVLGVRTIEDAVMYPAVFAEVAT